MKSLIPAGPAGNSPPSVNIQYYVHADNPTESGRHVDIAQTTGMEPMGRLPQPDNGFLSVCSKHFMARAQHTISGVPIWYAELSGRPKGDIPGACPTSTFATHSQIKPIYVLL